MAFYCDRIEITASAASLPFFFPPSSGTLEFRLVVENEVGISSSDTVLARSFVHNTTEVQIDSGCSHTGTNRSNFLMIGLVMGIAVRRRKNEFSYRGEVF